MTPDPTSVRAAAEAVWDARRIAVCSHVDPDGDAVGSIVALTRALAHAGKHVDAVLASQDHVPATYAFLVGDERFVRADGLEDRPDLVFALDTPNPRRLGDASALLEGATVVVIDHHPDNERFGDICVIDPSAPSTSAIIWDLIGKLGVATDQTILDSVYCGLMTDTGRFSFDNATPRAFRLAAELAEAGARASWVYRHVYEQRSPGVLALTARVLERLTLANEGAVAYSWFAEEDLRETGALLEETEDLIDAIRVIAGPHVVALFKCSTGRTKGSLRAKDSTDVGAVARMLGGGGHRAAAGFTVDAPLDAALEAVLPLLPARL